MRKYTKEIFIFDSIKIHGLKYNYSKVIYINCRTHVILECPIHGEFLQSPNVHLRTSGCPLCGNKTRADSKISPQESFIKKSIEIHKNVYDYSLVIYSKSNEKVNIICKNHGYFKQTPSNHLSGSGCPKCVGINKTTEELVNEFKKIHSDKYDYSLVKYTGSNNKVDIICREHGIFQQIPNNHIFGNRCPSCIESKGEEIIKKILKDKNVIFETQKKFENCKYKRQLKFDFYLPNINTCIEYDGSQHYFPRKDLGGQRAFDEQKIRDEIKNSYCKNNNIELIRIKYDENIKSKLQELKII